MCCTLSRGWLNPNTADGKQEEFLSIRLNTCAAQTAGISPRNELSRKTCAYIMPYLPNNWILINSQVQENLASLHPKLICLSMQTNRSTIQVTYLLKTWGLYPSRPPYKFLEGLSLPSLTLVRKSQLSATRSLNRFQALINQGSGKLVEVWWWQRVESKWTAQELKFSLLPDRWFHV